MLNLVVVDRIAWIERFFISEPSPFEWTISSVDNQTFRGQIVEEKQKLFADSSCALLVFQRQNTQNNR